MAMINAYKMDGLGNDFIIVDRRKKSIDIKKDKIIELGDRTNIGFDQIIFIEKKKENYFPITIFNSDGGEVSACGNGSRCVAYLLSKNLDTNQIKLKTNNRLLDAEIVGDFRVKLGMGKPLFNYNEIPLSKKVNPSNVTLKIDNEIFTGGFCVNMGNPHIVFFVNDCFKYELNLLGPKIENHELFPEKTNVTFAQVIDSGNIKVNVWERGAGLTKACGTAACAVAVAAFKNKLINNEVDIKFSEGVLSIKIDRENHIYMTGSVSKVKNIKLEI